MPFVQTFSGVLAPIRYDGLPWTNIYIQESATQGGTYVTRDTQVWSDANPATAEPTNITITTATLATGWYRMYWTDASGAASPFSPPVYSDGATGSTGPDLITLADFRLAQGTDVTDTRDDAKWTQWISFASDAIRAYTGRDFGAAVVTEERTFEYDGSGFVDIDDASVITAVTLVPGFGAADIVLTTDDWYGGPIRRDDAPLFTYVKLTNSGYVSPEMGFNRNLDVYFRDHRFDPSPRLVKVNGTWGWASTPGDVQMAAIWTLQDWESRDGGDGLTAESIEGYSRSWAARGAQSAAMAIPDRARDLLSNYGKVW